MGARGKKSSSAMQVAAITAVPRLSPPDELSDRQRSVWLSVVSAMPADWFDSSTAGLLVSYCRHAESASVVSGLLRGMESGGITDIDEYDKLLKMQEREGRAMSSLATRMRITQQSSMHSERSKKGLLEAPAEWS